MSQRQLSPVEDYPRSLTFFFLIFDKCCRSSLYFSRQLGGWLVNLRIEVEADCDDKTTFEMSRLMYKQSKGQGQGCTCLSSEGFM